MGVAGLGDASSSRSFSFSGESYERGQWGEIWTPWGGAFFPLGSTRLTVVPCYGSAVAQNEAFFFHFPRQVSLGITRLPREDTGSRGHNSRTRRSGKVEPSLALMVSWIHKFFPGAPIILIWRRMAKIRSLLVRPIG